MKRVRPEEQDLGCRSLRQGRDGRDSDMETAARGGSVKRRVEIADPTSRSGRGMKKQRKGERRRSQEEKRGGQSTPGREGEEEGAGSAGAEEQGKRGRCGEAVGPP